MSRFAPCIRRAPSKIDDAADQPRGRSASRSTSCIVRPSPAAQASRPATVAKAGPDAESGRPRSAIGRPRRTCLFEDAARQIARAGELTGAAGQHHARAGGVREAGAVQSLLHHLERFFQPRPNDVDHHAARHFGELMILLTDPRHRQHVALVVRAGCDVAVQRLQPFRVGHRCRQHPRQIAGDVQAAERSCAVWIS